MYDLEQHVRRTQGSSWDDPTSSHKILPTHCIWVLSTSTSIVTSRYLLYNLNWHYPFHLLSLELFCSLILNLCLANISDNNGELPTNTTSRWRHLLSDISFAVSMPLFCQTIFHIDNVLTLCLLSLLAYLPLLLQFFIFKSRTLYSFLRLSLFASGIAAIVADDYRLSVPLLAMGLPSILLSGAQPMLESNEKAALSPKRNTQKTCIGLVISLLLCLRFEIAKFGWTPMLDLDILDSWTPFVLVVNLVATILALHLGGNLVSAMSFEAGALTSLSRSNNWFSLSLAMMTAGFTGAAVLLAGPVTRLSWVQVAGYAVVALCILQPDFKATAQAIPISRCQAHHIFLADEETSYTDLPLIEVTNGAETSSKDIPRSNSGLQNRAIRIFCTTTLSLLTCIAWLTIFNHGFSSAPLDSPTPNLDFSYTNTTAFEIVMSMYSESDSTILSTLSTITSVPYIKTLNPKLTIYTKSSSNISSTLTSNLPPNTTILHLPNIGREGETYLHHILSNWDSLAQQTLFLQAELHNPAQIYARLNNYLGTDTGMLSLGFSGQSCDLSTGECKDRFGWKESSVFLQHVCSQANPGAEKQACENVLLSYKGQFVASGKRIRGTEKAVFEELRRLMDEDGWAHQEGYLKGRVDEMSRPVFGYTVERLWSAVLQCSSGRIARDCPSLLGGWRRGGERADCQCFD